MFTFTVHLITFYNNNMFNDIIINLLLIVRKCIVDSFKHLFIIRGLRIKLRCLLVVTNII